MIFGNKIVTTHKRKKLPIRTAKHEIQIVYNKIGLIVLNMEKGS